MTIRDVSSRAGVSPATVSRVFNAPRHLVFDAMMTPKLLERWLIANGRPMMVCEVDARVGGAYRYVWQLAGKKDVGMHGVHREIVRPSRIVRTEAWEDWEAGEILATSVLTEEGDKTRLTTTVVFPSQAVRDEVVKSGMTKGAGESYDHLERVLTEVGANLGGGRKP